MGRLLILFVVFWASLLWLITENSWLFFFFQTFLVSHSVLILLLGFQLDNCYFFLILFLSYWMLYFVLQFVHLFFPLLFYSLCVSVWIISIDPSDFGHCPPFLLEPLAYLIIVILNSLSDTSNICDIPESGSNDCSVSWGVFFPLVFSCA